VIRSALVAALLFATFPALAAPPPRDARQVIHRGARTLTDALVIATADAWQDPANRRPVAIVVDVTPNTRKAAARLHRSLDELGDRVRDLSGRWRLGPLGGRLSDAVRHPSMLTMHVDRALAVETRHRSTIRALRTTLSRRSDRGAVVVYLADWHFEDDEGLEPFVQSLVRARQSLRVIGSEAAYNRPWNDPFYPEVRVHRGQRFELGVGRCPFLTLDPESPWHGGDTAYPHLPWRFGSMQWRMSFPLYWGELSAESDEGVTEEPEELGDRLHERQEEDAIAFSYPLASSWGPYGLMRAAAVTGGRYVTWSWNPRGRKNVDYDYSRCSLFPPDLRSRAEILADVHRRPLTAAMLRAWHLIGSRNRCLAAITPPIDEDTRRPREMDYSGGIGCCACWCSRAAHEAFLRVSAANLRALDEALRVLDAALARPRLRDGMSPRHRADAEHFRHLVAVFRFQTAEGMAAARTLSPRAWDDPEVYPALQPVALIVPGEDGDRVSRVINVTPHDLEAGAELVRRHVDLIERYGGTPVGEIIARNEISTFQVTFIRDQEGEDDDGGRGARTPSESQNPRAATPRPPPTSSGGGGASTGR
jgi:hypothetical protein